MLKNIDNVKEVVELMSLDEKLALLVGGKSFSSLGIEKYGITEMSMCDGHNGINLMQKMIDIVPQVIAQVAQTGQLAVGRDEIINYLFAIGKATGGLTGTAKLLQGSLTEDDLSRMEDSVATFAKQFMDALPKVLPGGKLPTAYPVGMNMATTWNKALMTECGEKVGIEAKAYDVDILLAPNINIQRDPLCGRWFESFSEDPFVTSELVKPYIEGVQSTGVLGDVKHYVANNQETLRHEVDEIISERALREIYLPGFKAAIVDAKCQTVMTAYNSVNGEFCTENDFILNQVLRKDWGFEGLVLSDWNAVYNKVEALKAGNNLEMPGPNNQSEVKEAIENGLISETLIDEHITKILEAITKTNTFKGERLDSFDCEAHGEFSRKMAVESLVLLKNENVLPLKTNSIAITGSYANDTLACGSGSAGVISPYVISVIDGFENKYDNVTYTAEVTNECLSDSDVLVVVVGEMVGEGADRKHMKLDNASLKLIQDGSQLAKAQGKKTLIVLNLPGPVEMADWIDDVDAVLFAGFAGQEAGNAIADVVSGSANPSGKLCATFPVKYKDTPSYISFPGEFNRHYYGEGIFVGYRYYDAKELAVQFPFGYGLSYSNFQYKEIVVENEAIDLDKSETLKVKVCIKNTSELAGQEVIQLYVNDLESTLRRPEKELKGFEKVSFEPGQEQWITFELAKESFAAYDENLSDWIVEPGEFEVMVGSSSKTLPLKAKVTVLCENPYAIGLDTPISDIMKDSDLIAKISAILPEGALEIAGIQIEMIYHPELSIGECIHKYMAHSFDLTKEQVEGYLEAVKAVFEGI